MPNQVQLFEVKLIENYIPVQFLQKSLENPKQSSVDVLCMNNKIFIVFILGIDSGLDPETK
jgi:hypothetical protein